MDWREGKELSQEEGVRVKEKVVHLSSFLLLQPHLPQDPFPKTHSGFIFVFFEGQELERSDPKSCWRGGKRESMDESS